MLLGIMGAMSEEIAQLEAELKNKKTDDHGMRQYHQGTLWGQPVVLAFSRWGKVAAATTATHLISQYQVDRLIFTGVAGGIAHDMNLGDVVIGTELYQHDMDARPLFKRHVIPLLNKNSFSTDSKLQSQLQKAAVSFLKKLPPNKEFQIQNPKVKCGEIASGDQFFAEHSKILELRERLPHVLCVEMEGAAVAQVCHEYQIPFSIIRTISDSADEHAPINFQKFIQQVAQVYSHGIIKEWIEQTRA